MVHYDNHQAAYVQPPICPKCGSHRTQVIGQSSDGKRLTVRCGACGERSEIAVEETAPVARAQRVA